MRTLLNRANDASASSRLALQYQVIHLIGHLFTQVLPMPQASTLTTAMSFLDNSVDDVSSKTEEEEVQDVPKDDDDKIKNLVNTGRYTSQNFQSKGKYQTQENFDRYFRRGGI